MLDVLSHVRMRQGSAKRHAEQVAYSNAVDRTCQDFVSRPVWWGKHHHRTSEPSIEFGIVAREKLAVW